VVGPFEGHNSWTTSVACSPDGKWIASVSVDDWAAETGDLVSGPFEGYTVWISCIAFSTDSETVASGSADRMIRVCYRNGGHRQPVGRAHRPDHLRCILTRRQAHCLWVCRYDN
jgi:WD40 repeat protein